MKIGIISDTHNDIEYTKKALDIFISKNVDLIIHSGDLTSYKMLKLFQGLNCKFVLGNMDFDVEGINKESKRLGFDSIDYTCEITVDNKEIFVIHGNNVPVFRKAILSGKFDYIIKGHTHSFENYVSNNVRVINPGSLCGSREHCIIILSTDDDKIEKIDIDNY